MTVRVAPAGQPSVARWSTVSDIARERGQSMPEREAYRFLREGSLEGDILSYGGLDRRARSLAARLERIARGGDRVLLCEEPGLAYVSSFFGTLYAGMIPVPCYPPQAEREWERVASVAKSCDAAVICASDAFTDAFDSKLQRAGLANLGRICAEREQPGQGLVSQRDAVGAVPDIAFLQYTSGSTGVPKGVIVGHGNLLHNLQQIQRRFGHDATSRGVIWLPPYHDMGLIGGILEPLHSGFPVALLSPASFIKRPERWLRAIARFGATTSGGPNFAYDLCLKRIKMEDVADVSLATWSVAFTGAEAIRPETLRAFAAKFAPLGFRYESFLCCYGLAESTLMVTAGSRQTAPKIVQLQRSALASGQIRETEGAPDSRALVACGGTAAQEVRIVDPDTHEPCERGRVGEIWVRGPSVAAGYWSLPEQTRETFQVVIAGESGDTGARSEFMRTGDLGAFLHGELVITGRLKEVVISDGHNHYPEDIEATMQGADPACAGRAGVAFAVERDHRERCVAVQEVNSLARAELPSLARTIAASVLEGHGLALHEVVFVRPHQIPRTTSGKLRRGETRRLLESGLLKVTARFSALGACANQAPLDAAERHSNAVPVAGTAEHGSRVNLAMLESIVAAFLADIAGVDSRSIPLDEPFASWGLGSRQLTELAGELERRLDRVVPPRVLYECSTVRDLARFLAQGDVTNEVPNRQTRDGVKEARSRQERDMEANGLGDDAIAIIGMAARLPGADEIETFWAHLEAQYDAVATIPPSRWDVERYFDPMPGRRGKSYSKWMGALSNVESFDADFFQMSSREAAATDPQQRLLLEVTWEALEHAGIAPHILTGGNVGVFFGLASNDYGRLLESERDIDAHSALGNAASAAAGRVSYALGLMGPSLVVDTACSSSLVATHLAVRSLRAGECELALVGGANLIVSPHSMIAMSRMRALSPVGRCRTFDAAADGYVRGEGCGVLVLKPLSRARRDGDRVLALIRGSAVNQDGRSNGLTAPNAGAQRAVIRGALKDAGLQPEDIGYVEAHGTGTALGDPIELHALAAALRPDPTQGGPLVVSSVKANIGHLEAAAGVASLVKVVLALRARKVPGQIHLARLNPHVNWERSSLSVPRESVSCDSAYAGVSAFGFTGTNAHVIVERAPDTAPSRQADRSPELIVLSAKTQRALHDQTDRLAEWLARNEQVSLSRVACELERGRTPMAHRFALVCESVSELREALRRSSDSGLAEGQVAPAAGRVRLALHAGSELSNLLRAACCVAAFDREAGERFALLARQLGIAQSDLFSTPSGLPPHTHATLALVLECELARWWSERVGVPDWLVTSKTSLPARGALCPAVLTGKVRLQEALQVLGLARGDAERIASCASALESRAMEVRTSASDLDGENVVLLSLGLPVSQGSVDTEACDASPARLVLQLAARLFVSGLSVRMRPGKPAACGVPLPTYAFQRRRFWIDQVTKSARSRAGSSSATTHPWLTDCRPSSKGASYRLDLQRDKARIMEHRIAGRALMPMAGYLSAAYAAAVHSPSSCARRMTDISVMRPLDCESTCAVRLCLERESEDRLSFVFSHDGDTRPVRRPESFAYGSFGGSSESGFGTSLDRERLQQECSETLPAAVWYERALQAGLHYGPSYHVLRELQLGDDCAVAQLGIGSHRAALSEVVLDAPLQLLAALMNVRLGGGTYVAARLGPASFAIRPCESLWAFVRASGLRHNARGSVFEAGIVDERGAYVVRLENISMSRLAPYADYTSLGLLE